MPEFDPELYSTVAQVLPVLLVVVFVELILSDERRRLFNYEDGDPFLLTALSLAVGAEIICLLALDQQTAPSALGKSVIFGGLLWPTFLLVAAVANPIVTEISKTTIGFLLVNAYYVGIIVAIGLAVTNVIDFVTFVVVACYAPMAMVVVLSVVGQGKALRKGLGTDRPARTDWTGWTPRK